MSMVFAWSFIPSRSHLTFFSLLRLALLVEYENQGASSRNETPRRESPLRASRGVWKDTEVRAGCDGIESSEPREALKYLEVVPR